MGKSSLQNCLPNTKKPDLIKNRTPFGDGINGVLIADVALTIMRAKARSSGGSRDFIKQIETLLTGGISEIRWEGALLQSQNTIIVGKLIKKAQYHINEESTILYYLPASVYEQHINDECLTLNKIVDLPFIQKRPIHKVVRNGDAVHYIYTGSEKSIKWSRAKKMLMAEARRSTKKLNA